MTINFLIQNINMYYDFISVFKDKLEKDKSDWGLNKYNYWVSDVPHGYDSTISKCIPIGTVEFVRKFYKTYHNIDLKPINLTDIKAFDPEDSKIFFRKIGEGKLEDVPDGYFFKMKDVHKSNIKDIGIMDKFSRRLAHPADYIFSEPIDIISEYRCFIYKGEWIGAKQYQGDFRVSPRYDLMKITLDRLGLKGSYTVDFALGKDGYVHIIEIHDFMSCGLYGFDDDRILEMAIDSHESILKTKGKTLGKCSE